MILKCSNLVQTEHEDPYQRQAPWPPRSKVKVARSHDASDRCWPISREQNVTETPKNWLEGYPPHGQQCLQVSRSNVKRQGHMVNNTTNNSSFRTTNNRVFFTFARWRYQYYNFTTVLHCHSLLARWRYRQEQHGVGSHVYEYILVFVSYS